MHPILISVLALGGLILTFEAMRLILPRVSSSITTVSLTGSIPAAYAYMQEIDLGVLIGTQNVSLAMVIGALFLKYTRIRTGAAIVRPVK